MKAGDESLSAVFTKDHRYVIPIFQRPYVWNEQENWLPLWHDISKAAERVEDQTPHDDAEALEYFLGAFVTQHRSPVPRRKPTSMVIDGQQRMTTLQVFLAAARRVSAEVGATVAADNFGTLVRNRVSDDSEYPEDRFKIAPLAHDRAAFEWAVRGPEAASAAAPAEAHRLVLAARWFESILKEWLTESEDPHNRLDLLHFAVENRFKVVSIFLDGRDDPQVIFEALNHRGVRLDAADLVKNLLFQSLDRQGNHHLEEELLRDYWALLDDGSWRKEVTTGRIKRSRVDTLLAYWLSAQRGEESSVEHLFEDFKRWLRATEGDAADVIRSIRTYADTMDRLQSLPMISPVAQVIDRLEATQTTTPWPLLLFLHADPGVPAYQAEKGTRALDSFLMRRAICRLTTKDYNRLFGSLLGDIKVKGKDLAGDVLISGLASQVAESRYWPDDRSFLAGLRSSNLFHDLVRARLRTLLVGLENQLLSAKAESTEPHRSATSALTIEHVIPVAWEKHWNLPDPATDHERSKREAAIHALGNLTLATGSLNSGMKNAPWSIKRHTLQTHSLARLTTGSVLTYPAGVLGWTQDEWTSAWDEERVEVRGAWLARAAIHTWPREGDLPTDLPVWPAPGANERTASPERRVVGAEARTRVVFDVQGDLRPLITGGLVAPGDRLVYERARTSDVFEAIITDTGSIRTVHGEYDAPSPALSKLVGHSRNGWTDWTHVPTGRTLAELRDRLLHH